MCVILLAVVVINARGAEARTRDVRLESEEGAIHLCSAQLLAWGMVE
jgi:hypothetical protein